VVRSAGGHGSASHLGPLSLPASSDSMHSMGIGSLMFFFTEDGILKHAGLTSLGLCSRTDLQWLRSQRSKIEWYGVVETRRCRGASLMASCGDQMSQNKIVTGRSGLNLPAAEGHTHPISLRLLARFK